MQKVFKAIVSPVQDKGISKPKVPLNDKYFVLT